MTARKKYTTEQIVLILKKVKVLCSQGKSIAKACRQNEISEQTYYR
ncbi:transposase [Anaerotignum sp.]